MPRWLLVALVACSHEHTPAPPPAAELPPAPAPKPPAPKPQTCHWASYASAGMGREIDGVHVTGSHIDVDLETGKLTASLIVDGYDAPFHRVERTLDLAERTRLTVLLAFAIAEPHPDRPPVPDVSERLGMCEGTSSVTIGGSLMSWPASAAVVKELRAIAPLTPPRRVVTPRAQLPAELRDRLPRHGMIVTGRVIDFDRHTVRDGANVTKLTEPDEVALWRAASLAWVDDPDRVHAGDAAVVFADGNEVMVTSARKPFAAKLVELLAR